MLASCYKILNVFFNLDFIVIFFFAMSRSPESWSEILTVEIYYKSHSDMVLRYFRPEFFYLLIYELSLL